MKFFGPLCLFFELEETAPGDNFKLKLLNLQFGE
jgi:hypothetical protein